MALIYPLQIVINNEIVRATEMYNYFYRMLVIKFHVFVIKKASFFYVK